MKELDYRYLVYNTVKKEYQFARICETTEKGARKILFKLIGNDARKWRFEIRKVEKDNAQKIIKSIKLKREIEKIREHLPKFTAFEIEELINENVRRENGQQK